MWVYLVSGAVFGLAAGAQPGPFLAYLAALTLKHGLRRSLPAVLAPLLSDGLIVAVTLLILTHVPSSFIRVLHLLGGAFLLYLAWEIWQSWQRYDPEAVSASRVTGLLKAMAVNLLNPNPYLGWSLVLGPLVLKGWHQNPRYGAAVVAGFYFALMASTIGVLLLFEFARSRGTRAIRVLMAASAVALAVLGVYEFWSGLWGNM
jgi:threonine/homoserine/homoserine lactone efflux protein